MLSEHFVSFPTIVHAKCIPTLRRLLLSSRSANSKRPSHHRSFTELCAPDYILESFHEPSQFHPSPSSDSRATYSAKESVLDNPKWPKMGFSKAISHCLFSYITKLASPRTSTTPSRSTRRHHYSPAFSRPFFLRCGVAFHPREQRGRERKRKRVKRQREVGSWSWNAAEDVSPASPYLEN